MTYDIKRTFYAMQQLQTELEKWKTSKHFTFLFIFASRVYFLREDS